MKLFKMSKWVLVCSLILLAASAEGFSPSTPKGESKIKTETVMLPGDVPIEMVWIPAGTFMMGGLNREQDSSKSLHKVTLSSGFWMGKYELTKRQWTAVTQTTPWSGYKTRVSDDLDSPAICVSWNDAQSFITKLNNHTGLTFRLPSEAEWEYACRAGTTTTRFYWGEDPDYTAIKDYAWWAANTSDANELYAHVVGQKLPNAWGLYDMSGNVWEWCQDWYHSSYTDAAPTDGSAWESPTGTTRVVRGGSWHVNVARCRSADRYSFHPDFTDSDGGFRIVRTP